MKENVEENRPNSFKRGRKKDSSKKKKSLFSSDSAQPLLLVCASDLSIQVKFYRPWHSKKVLCVFYWHFRHYRHFNILDIEA